MDLDLLPSHDHGIWVPISFLFSLGILTFCCRYPDIGIPVHDAFSGGVADRRTKDVEYVYSIMCDQRWDLYGSLLCFRIS